MTRKKDNLTSLAKREDQAAEGRKLDRLAAFDLSGPANGADWGGCSPDWLQSVVQKITAMDGAVIFGTSKDGGAHLVTLLLDDNRKTLWFGAGDDLDEKLEELCATLDSMV